MATRIKRTKDITSSTDEFLTVTGRALGWVEDNWRIALAATGGALLMVGTVAGVRYYQGAHRATESAEFGQVIMTLGTAFEPDAHKATADAATPPTDWDAVATQLGTEEGKIASPELRAITRFYRARALSKAGKPTEALPIYTALAAPEAHDVPFEFTIMAQYDAGVLLFDQGDYADALKYFQDVVDQRRETPATGDSAAGKKGAPKTEILLVEALRYVGRCHEHLGNFEAAIAAYENTLRIAPPESPAIQGLNVHLAMVRAEQQKRAAARAATTSATSRPAGPASPGPTTAPR